MASGQARLQPRKQPRQQRSEQTRSRILEAAAHIFATHGYAAGTTNRIAEWADVSIGSLYQYFPNKDAILVELMTRHVRDGSAAVQRIFGSGLPDSLSGGLRLFVRAAVDNHRDAPQLHRVLFEEAPRPPQLLALLHSSEATLIDAAATVLSASPEVSLSDPRAAARIVVATIESLTHRLIATNTPMDCQVFEDEVVAMLTRYLVG